MSITVTAGLGAGAAEGGLEASAGLQPDSSHPPPTAGPRPAQRAARGEDHMGSQLPLLCQALGARLGPPTSF